MSTRFEAWPHFARKFSVALKKTRRGPVPDPVHKAFEPVHPVRCTGIARHAGGNHKQQLPAHWLRDLEAQKTIRQVSDDLCDYSKWNLEDPVEAGSVCERYPGW